MDFLVLPDIAKPLLAWYDAHARVLPWRDTPTPYRVWISEIMLQQTRVQTVIPYFERFIRALPDIKSLAGVTEETLLKLWEGLGYYSRARNLQTAARRLIAEHGGALPASYEKLLTLPGIGDYTAGAIASIAFGLPHAAVDGNVLRVISRLAASEADISQPRTKRMIRQAVEQILPREQAGAFNQALMELGATVCLASGAPVCKGCPLQKLCGAFTLGLTEALPLKEKKKARRVECRTVLVLTCGGKTALHKRGEGGLLSGLWELPNLAGHLPPQEAAAEAAARFGVRVKEIERLANAKHIFTHIEWHMIGYRVKAEDCGGIGLLWVSDEQRRQAYALPSAFRPYANEAGSGKA